MTTVGQKTEQRNDCIRITTVLLGMCLIFPLFFTCCMWWKKLVYPKYEVIEEVYRAIWRFCSRSPHCTVINLSVADNAFNGEKARMIYEGLSSSSVRTFNFTNMALACNYRENEIDNFQMNVAPCKQLDHITSTFTWGDETF